MRKVLLAGLMLLAASVASSSCLPPSGGIPVTKLRLGDPGNVWIGCTNDSLDRLSNGAASTGTAAGIAASTTSIYAALNSTGSALTNETARAIARENTIAASTGTTYAALNSTASALTIETNTRQTFQTLTAANTTTIYAALNSTGSALTLETTARQTLQTLTAANTTTIYAALNSTGSALTVETNTRQAFQTLTAANTTTIYAALNSTGSALTVETNTRQAFQTLTAANTTTIYAAINSTGAALTVETARALAAESVLSASTVSLNNLKLSSPTVAGAVGNSLTLGSNGQPTWAAITGGGGLSSIPITSGTVVGNSTGTFNPQNAVSNLYLDSAGLDYIVQGSTAIIKVKNLTFITSVSTVIPTQTSNHATYAGCLTGSTMTWTQGNNKTMFGFHGYATMSANSNDAVVLVLDGAIPSGEDTTNGSAPCTGAVGADGCNLAFTYVTPVALSAGSHSACLAEFGANTMTLQAGSNTGNQFWAAEQATGGAGYSVPASSDTIVPVQGGNWSNTAFSSCLSSVTATLSSTFAAIYFNGTLLNSNNTANTGLIALQDGALLPGETTTKGFAYSNEGNVNGQNQAPFYQPISTSSGTHTWCIGGFVSATTGNFGASTVNHFGVIELKNSAGTGDVSSNGANTLSGANTISASGSLTIAQGSTMSLAQTPVTYSAVAGSTIAVSTPAFISGGWGPIISTANAGPTSFISFAGLPSGAKLSIDLDIQFPTMAQNVGVHMLVNGDHTSGNYPTQVIESNSGRVGPNAGIPSGVGCSIQMWQAVTSSHYASYHMTVFPNTAASATGFHGTFEGVNNDGSGTGTWGCRYTAGNMTSLTFESISGVFTIKSLKITRLGD